MSRRPTVVLLVVGCLGGPATPTFAQQSPGARGG